MRVSRFTALILCLSVAGTARASLFSALSDAYAQTQSTLSGALGQTGSVLAGSLGQTADATSGALTQSLTAGGDALTQSLTASGDLLNHAFGTYVAPTPGTTSTVRTISFGGQNRQYLVIQPVNAMPAAPAMILLHPLGTSEQTMANITAAGRLAADDGVNVYLPVGLLNAWNDDPASLATTDDVGFLSAVIDDAAAKDQIDTTRVFMAGYSSGAFMTERFACDLSGKIAGIGMVDAEMRKDEVAACSPDHAVPVVEINQTQDPVVPYKGEIGLLSAADSVAFWRNVDGCTTAEADAQLPVLVNDGTSVASQTWSDCTGGSAVKFYTVTGGGHTWPGSPLGIYTIELGKTTGNLDATLQVWSDLSQFSR